MKNRFSTWFTAILLFLFLLPLFARAQDSTITTRDVYAYAGVPASGTNEVDTLTIASGTTSGTFTITVASGRTTAPITWSATNATLVARVDAALEALSVIGTGGVTTAEGSLTAGIGTITITFAGKNAKRDMPALSIGTNSLVGGDAPTLTTTTAGVAATWKDAPTGTLLMDSTNAVLYTNTSTTAGSPTWTANPSTLALDTSAELRTLITDETGTGVAVFATTPTLVTPVIGAATGTSLNLGATGVLSTTAQSGTGSIAMTTSPTFVTPALGAATATSLAAAGAVTSSSPSAKIGYTTGAGGAVTQGTNRTTTVTMVPNPCTSGAVTTTNDSIAALGLATFTVTNSAVALGDTVIVSKVSGDVDTFVFVSTVAAGSFNVTLRNSHATDADVTAFVFNFAVIKAVSN
jgi:hypothetical protein